MNHLAHIFLSCADDDIVLGNFIADYLMPSEVRACDGGILQGIRLHRSIDQYTDAHPEISAMKRLIRPQHRRYAPVVVDVFCDYLLIHHWHRFSTEELRAFIDHSYHLLIARQDQLPPILQNSIVRMVADDWLMQFGSVRGVQRSLTHLSKRSSRPEWFIGASITLKTHQELLANHFLRFFPDLLNFVQQWCEEGRG